MPALTISDELFQRLAKRAAALNLTVEQLIAPLLQLAAEGDGDRHATTSPERPADISARLAALEKIGSYDTRVRAGLPPLSPEDLSRASIYEGRGR